MGLLDTAIGRTMAGAWARSTGIEQAETANPPALVMRNGYVADMSASFAKALGLEQHVALAWHEVKALFDWRFPNIPGDLPDIPAEYEGFEGDTAKLRFGVLGDVIRIELVDRASDIPERHAALRLSRDFRLFGTAVEQAPYPIWRLSPNDEVVWSNPAYRLMLDALGHDSPEVPLVGSLPSDPTEGVPFRVELKSTADSPGLWYEIIMTRENDDRVFFAADIGPLVRAEVAQRNFVQTLAKTFAHLPIGLAIFDRSRELALFNPALIDLTSLSAEFLSGRPNLFSFFDHLRETQMMPEPKNYGNWRRQMADLIQAASSDTYCETWTLPSGLTYKVTGRPHPDGAVAFLFEDISAEISLTRRFRAELDLSQSAFDVLDDGVAIFSQLGVLTMCNEAFRTLWEVDPDAQVHNITIQDMTRIWQSASLPSPSWADLRDFVQTETERAIWDMDVTHKAEGLLHCRVAPLKGASTMVRFRRAEPDIA